MAGRIVKGLSTRCQLAPCSRVQQRLSLRHRSAVPVAPAADVSTVVAAAASGENVRDAKGSLIAQAMHWPKVYLELGKFRLSGLVVCTTASGYYMTCSAVDPYTLGVTLTGTALAALSANSLNQWYEIANDSKMGRTMKRPLPSGRISPPHALAFGLSSGTVGSALLATQVNPVAGGIALSNILLYTCAYTPMKVVHPVNTWIGALVGGLPPLIGCAAATGTLTPESGLIAAMLFSWQFPHFMALAHYSKKDYLAGGYKMLSDKRAAGVGLRHSLYLIPMGVAAPMMGMTTWAFGVESLLINGYMAYHAFKFYQNPVIKTAKQCFRTSLWHLPALMVLMAFHKVASEANDEESEGRTYPTNPEDSWIFPLPRCTRFAIDEIANGPAK